MDSYDATTRALLEEQKREFEIIKATTLVSGHPNTGRQTSDGSVDALDNSTPAGLELELQHYKVAPLTRRSPQTCRMLTGT